MSDEAKGVMNLDALERARKASREAYYSIDEALHWAETTEGSDFWGGKCLELLKLTELLDDKYEAALEEDGDDED